MATTIKTKNSVTTTVVPTSLAQGELAVNIADKKIWVGNAATTPVLISDYSGSIIGGSNTQVQYNNNGAFAGSSSFVFDGTNVGIGTSSPSQKLHVASASSTYIQVQNTGNSVNAYYGVDTAGGWMGTSTNHYAAFYTNNTERMRLDTSGNLGIGTNNPTAKLDISQNFNGTAQARIQNTNAGTGAAANLTVGNGTTSGQLVQAGTGYGGYGAWLASETLLYASTNLDLMADAASGVIKFSTGGSGEKMRLDSSGKLGIGTTTPTANLHLMTASGTTAITMSTNNNQNANASLYNDATYFGIGTNFGSTGVKVRMNLQTPDSALTINGTGNLVLAGGTIGATGIGLTFPATQSASSDANTLDDYEEGTWTPSLGGTATYTNRVGNYTKIGNVVHIYCLLSVNAIGTGSVNTISGLPFSAAQRGAGSLSYFNSLSKSVVFLSPFADAATVKFDGTTAASPNTTDPIDIFQNSSYVVFSATYFV